MVFVPVKPCCIPSGSVNTDSTTPWYIEIDAYFGAANVCTRQRKNQEVESHPHCFLRSASIDVSKAKRLVRFLGGCALATKPALAYVLTARGIPAASPRWFAAAGGDIGVGVRLVSEWVDVGQFLD
jgi:hypothetical protein